jgi:hypothetical protein
LPFNMFSTLKKHLWGWQFPSDDTTEAEVQKPFLKWQLDLGFSGVNRWKLLASQMFLQFAKCVKVQGGWVKAVCWVGWGPQMTSGVGCALLHCALENLIICYDKCPNMFGNYVEKYRTDVQRYPCAFLVSTYHHLCKKKRGNLTWWPPLVLWPCLIFWWRDMNISSMLLSILPISIYRKPFLIVKLTKVGYVVSARWSHKL